MSIDRRSVLAGAAAMLALTAGRNADAAAKTGAARSAGAFPPGFRWGVATAGHQVEGNNTNSDTWFLENVKPTIFAEPSGDSCNNLQLWAQDLDLVKSFGLNTYRFSIEWARVEPEPGQFSVAMLDHYARIVDGCHSRGLMPMVTFNHFTTPRWFAAAGGWTHADAPAWFARYCERTARRVAPGIGYATTLNEPNLPRLLKLLQLPSFIMEGQRAMLLAAAKACGSAKFVAANAVNDDDLPALQAGLLEAHRLGRQAIKSARSALPVGVSLALTDDQAVGDPARRDARRADLYAEWLELAKGDDFVGVQNYERSRTGPEGTLPPPPDAPRNWSGAEIYAPSLGNAVRYAHAVTGRPVMVTEHGLGTDDDTLRAAFIPQALSGLAGAIAEGVPVLGYMHWSLLDNFEWIFGYRPKYGLVAVDRKTFKRTPKPSAAVLGAIARRNSL